uniref:Death domain-containing protein n=1 Tax=Schistocephalus solidus TaxID=70667 RepID=A0A0X3PWI0_SCHSO
MGIETPAESTDDVVVLPVKKIGPDVARIEHDCFLVSFLVDARGGSMRGSRHAGLRILVPPSAASAPTRVTCRMLRPERTASPPQLNDGEGLACRIIELGPHPCSFNSPVLLEIPHFASLRGRQREIVVLRSDDAETWKEHSLEASDQAVRQALGSKFDSLETAEQLREKRIIRVLLTDFPQYLAVVSRLRQEIAMIGSDGGVLSSTVVPQVQAVFPEGTLQKRIRVGLQAHQIPSDLVARLVGSRVTASPIVTVEPRRRKFHKPITLTIPLPRSALTGKPGDMNSLRLLCSITGGTSPAVWEDITGTTPLSRVKDCVSFTSTVSARFWLIVCPEVTSTVPVAMRLYDEVASVPYMGKFIVFAKRPEVDEALIRCFCITDDKVDKTLECQEGFDLVAASNEVEVIDNQPTWLEASGNLAPVVKADDQLRLHFNAFRENRLAFPVRIRDMELEPSGKLVFLRDPRPGSDAEAKPLLPDSSAAQTEPPPVRSICGLEVKIPTDLEHHHFALQAAVPVVSSGGDVPNKMTSETSIGPVSVVSLSCSQPHQYEHVTQNQPNFDSHGRDLSVPPPSWVNALGDDAIARSQLDLIEVATAVGSDWPKLVMVLFAVDSTELPPSADNLAEWITRHCTSADTVAAAGLNSNELRSDRDRALAIIIAWKTEAGDAATGNELDNALRRIGREDIVKTCMRDILPVLETKELEQAAQHIDRSCTWSAENMVQEAVDTSSEVPSSGQLESGQMEATPDFVGDRAREVVEFSAAALVSPEPTLTTTTLEPSIPETEPAVDEATLPKSEAVAVEEAIEQQTVEDSVSEAVKETPINLVAREEPFVIHTVPETFTIESEFMQSEQKEPQLASAEMTGDATQEDVSAMDEFEAPPSNPAEYTEAGAEETDERLQTAETRDAHHGVELISNDEQTSEGHFEVNGDQATAEGVIHDAHHVPQSQESAENHSPENQP